MSETRHKLHEYQTREALAEALATGTAAVLAGGIATRGEATLAVSGGSTPRLYFQKLSQADIDWSAVTVILVDERWVPSDHHRSNGALLQDNLLQGPAAAAKFEPFHRQEHEAREGARELDALYGNLPRPFDAVILGMGSDGHTASFFPGGERLAEALDPQADDLFVSMEAPDAGEPRVTLTLPPIAEAHFLALHIEGEEKQTVLSRALEDGPAEDMPVRAVLRARRERPIEIFWAP